jgi:hypothetical protein
MRLFVLLAALLLIVSACQTRTEATIIDDGTQVVSERAVVPEGKGRLLYALTASDPQSDLRSVRMTVDSVEAYNSEDGWVTINGDEDTYDLTKLVGVSDLLGDRVIDAQTYSQVRMKISSVIVEDATGSHDAVLTNNELIIAVPFSVVSTDTVAVTFDFLIDESVRETSDGRYVFLPTVRMVVQNAADVNIVDDRVVVRTGQVVTNTVVTTNTEGRTGTDVTPAGQLTIVVQNGEPRVVERTVYQNTTVVYNNTYYVTQNSTTNTSGNATA